MTDPSQAGQAGKGESRSAAPPSRASDVEKNKRRRPARNTSALQDELRKSPTRETR